MKFNSLIRKSSAFTLIEVIVTLSIIGVLSAISIVSYGSWSKSLDVNTMKNDLINISNAMEGVRTFSNAYSTNLPTSFKASPGITIVGGGSSDGKSYCVTAISSKNPTVQYYVNSAGGVNGIATGSCAPMEITATASSDSAIAVTWSSVAGATSYTIQRDINSSFSSPTDITQAGTSLNSTGLTQFTRYYYRVSALINGVSSVWSKTVDARTNLYIPPPPEEPPVSNLVISFDVEPYGVNMRVIATIAPYTTCPTGTAQYSLRRKTGFGAWSSYTTWSDSVRSIATGWVGTEDPETYYFEAISRCYVDAGNITNIITTTNNHTVGGSGPSEM